MKPVYKPETREITYDEARWKILEDKRKRGREILEHLKKNSIYGILHGSVARGDVSSKSDVDIFIPNLTPSYIIELSLEENIMGREIVQATPWQLIKGQIILDNNTTVTFPLVRPKRLEYEFYLFGGQIDLKGIKEKKRVPGMDKRLMMIEPTEKGHIEYTVFGREAEVAKKIGVSVDIVRERIDVLRRRDIIGRTGVYLKRTLSPEESFEEVLKKILDRDVSLRRRAFQ